MKSESERPFITTVSKGPEAKTGTYGMDPTLVPRKKVLKKPDQDN